MRRPVTEEDFRKPEFRGAKPEDYEFREDDAFVRKDLWQTAIYQIRCTVSPKGREFEIVDVVKAVERIAGNWHDADPEEDPGLPMIDLRLSCGTILTRCERRSLPFYTPGEPERDIVIEDQGLDRDEVVSAIRRRGLSIDGDNAYKRDLLDATVGVMAMGVQNSNPRQLGIGVSASGISAGTNAR